MPNQEHFSRQFPFPRADFVFAFAASMHYNGSAEYTSWQVTDMDKWDARFMELAGVIANWASCYKPNRKIGAVIVKNKRIVTTGYNGAPAGIKTCVERGECLREKLGIASGTRHEICYAVHAEQNAIIQAARLGSSIDGATLYCTHQPCVLCAKMIVNSGIKRVVYQEGYPDEFSLQMLSEGGVELERFTPDDDV